MWPNSLAPARGHGGARARAVCVYMVLNHCLQRGEAGVYAYACVCGGGGSIYRAKLQPAMEAQSCPDFFLEGGSTPLDTPLDTADQRSTGLL